MTMTGTLRLQKLVTIYIEMHAGGTIDLLLDLSKLSSLSTDTK